MIFLRSKRTMQYAIQRCLFIALITLLFACGGGDDEITDFVTVPDVRVESIEVVSGGTLYFGENVVEDFDPDTIGTYRVALDDEATESISLIVSLGDDADDTRLQLIELGKGSDDSDKTTGITAGVSFPVEIREGVNFIYIRASSGSTAARVDYSIQINRISSSAALQDIRIGGIRGTDNNNSAVVYSNDFTAERLDYDVEIDGALCGISFLPEPESRFAQIRIDGVLTPWGRSVFIPLQAGSTSSIEVEVSPEDGGAALIYTFDLLKEAETESYIESDSLLSSLSLAAAREIDEFKCADSVVSYRANLDALDSLSLVADIYEDRAGAVLTFGVDDEDNDSLVLDEDTAETLEPGVAYSGTHFDNLDAGNHLFLLKVVSADGDSTTIYQIIIVVSETNEVYVSTVEELQAALQAAAANDEIIVASGEYAGLASVATSGNDSAHFYSNSDGSLADGKIILRAGGDDVVLSGSDQTQNTVLLLEGNYWQVEGIEFTNAQNGVVLNAVDNVILENINVNNVGARAVIMQAGTTNSQMKGGFIDRTGLAQQGDVDETFGEGVVIGLGDGVSRDNGIRHVVFGRNIANEHIELKANAVDTALQFNIFESDNTLDNPFSARSIVALGGGSTELSYNQFEFDEIAIGSDEIAQLIDVRAVDGATVEIFQNIFDLNGLPIVAISNDGAATVSVADNRRADAGDIAISGDVSTGSTPVYRIQSTVDSSQCLSLVAETANGSEVIEDLITTVDCADSVEQQWVFVHREDGFVQIVQNLVGLNNKLNLRSYSGVLSGATVPLLNLREDLDSEDDVNFLNAAYTLQWKLNYSGNKVSFSNRHSTDGFIAEVSGEVVEGIDLDPVPIFVQVDVDSVEVEFTLIRL